MSEVDTINALRISTGLQKKRPSKGQRVSLACDNCHTSKKKCDGARPCGHCQRLNKQCVFARESMSRARSNYVLALEQRLAQIEKNVLEYAPDKFDLILGASYQSSVHRNHSEMSGDVDGNSSDAGDSADESRKGGDQGSISTPMNSGHDLAPVAAVNGGDIWSSPQRGPTGPFGGPFGLPAAGPPYPPNPSYPTSGDPAPSLHPHPSFSYAGNNNPMYYSQTGHSPPQGQPPLGDGGNGQAQALAYINAGYYHPHAAVGNHAPDADQRAMSYDPPLTNSSSSINDVGGGGHGHPRRHEELLQLLSSAATYPSHGGMSSTDDGDNALTTINQATSSSTSERLRLKAILSD